MPKTELQGSLELLVLKILRRGPNHGFAIASNIQQASDDVLRVEAGSLYPALHRMTEAGLITAGWQLSDAGRRARGYAVTPKGRREPRGRSERLARGVDGGVENSSRNLTGGVSWGCGRGWREPSAAVAMTTTLPRSCGFTSSWTSPRGATRARRGFASAT